MGLSYAVQTKDEMKCKNCGKLKKNHHIDGQLTKRYWCNPVDKFPAGDKRYIMKYEEETQSL